ncbi:fibrillin-1-like [Limulus polyphemus]|uniref:Fibrillin-1-like n=1 Tax=Limulus polyphemus TaxID=6850 RepID=A0ABM1SDQ1_LIMPO|nr:fibrillin-1-like [Limulus polyphemus]
MFLYLVDPCVNHCGVQAVCLVESHKAVCRCRPGYTGDPYLGGCESIQFCELAPCHSSAKCVHVPGSYKCHCPTGYLGDPYTNGCHHPNSCPNGDSDCPTDSACMDDPNEGFLCKNPCEQASCGSNSNCQVIDHQATCSCLDNFRGNPTPNDGCVRVSQHCLLVEDCGSDNQACVSGQCRLFCTRDSECAVGEKCIKNRCTIPCFSHNNCPSGEACITNGFCQLGCRENAECGPKMACIQNKCEDPCKIVGVCGSHAHCDVKNHEPSCSCPPGFEGNPSPVLGCKRVITVCSPVDSCPPPFICVMERCRPPCDKCVEGEKCIDNICLVSCTSDSNCPTGEICINQHCQVGCRNTADCHLSQICDSYSCICKTGFQRNASGCSDIDECSSNPCHPTATCENSPGTFYCGCRTGQIGDGFKGCYRPGECPNGDSDCPFNSACGQDENGIPKCVDPCSESPCGPNAGCVVYNHKPECFCPKTGLFTGDPYDKQKGCIKVDCLHDADCATDQHCLQFRCESPCTTVDCGPEGTCVVRNRQAVCRCQPGFENNNHLSCIDIDECKLHPCHSSAICENVQGSYTCSCPLGLVGDPRISPGCHDPNICYNGNSDCLDTAACMLVDGVPYCKDPCDDPTSCGVNATCKAVNHEAVCSCPFGFTGNPEIQCKKVECIKNQECHNNEVCLKNRCVDACLGQIICGKNTNCVSQDHSSICRCQDGYYGDPVAGCRKIITCVKDQDCPSGEFCYNGKICRVACNSNRDCGLNELCHEEKCITVCQGNSDCPEGQACVDEKCINVDRCSSDTDCEGIETCRSNSKGYNDCQNSCATVLCGQNAICVAEEHTGVCQCPPNFVGNPLDDYIGCQKAECIAHKHCQQDKVCHNSKCVDPCTLHSLCGENAYCIAEDHAAVCRCRSGYEGDPLSGCQLIDHCVKRPCHPTANCRNRFGGYECQCPEDKNIGNPYNHPGCRGPNECPSGNTDCPPTATCVTNGLSTPICKNPCQLSDVCGRNAICKVEYHQPVCQCPEQFSGNPNDPIRGCVRVLVACESDKECSAGFVCSNQRCRFPCESVQDCADGEFCIEDHCVQECQNDNECFRREICIAQKCLVGCRTDAECTSKESCMQNKCRDSCESPTVCGTNAICSVENHNPHCKCPPGFIGDPEVECHRVLPNCTTGADCPLNHFCIRGQCLVECNTDGDCAVGEKCFNNHCVGLCHNDSECQQNEICVSNRCEVGCRAGNQCPDHMACVSNQCRDPCEGSATCGPNAVCKVVNHRSVCSCPTSFVGRPNANVGCIRVSTTCSDNSECPFGYYCFNEFCRVACSSDKDCVVNEKCSNGRCFIQCLQDRDCPSVEICKQNLCQVGCRSDNDCLFNEACINSQCLDPCGSPTVCGTNALCQVTNHLTECFCPPELTGDAKIECNRVPTKCTNDNECGPEKYCDASMCAVACSIDTECLDNEKCIDRRCSVICTSDESCPGGYICETGQCIPGCRNDFECPLMDACISLQCINPCDSPTACGTNAQCQPVDHQPFCTCLPNYTGDPRVECNKVDCIIDSNCGATEICQNYKCIEGCRSDNSCPPDMTCIRRKCEDPCQFSAACGAHAICKTEAHTLLCSCPVGFSGNPLLECFRVGVCTVSADCKEGQVCEDNKCLPQVECRNNSECQLGEICLQNKCFEGCHTDDNCPFDQSCISGQCQNPCLVRGACGLKAVCSTVQHERSCTCPPGFTGNPKTQCQEFIGTCNSEDDCLAGTICQNGQCVVSKGCSSDNDCARGQICDNTTCVYGCRSHSDCEFDMACVGRQCQNPCSEDACGTDAKCLAINHQANCRCPEGYTGSAKTHCYPLVEDCYADNDCELGKLCISNKCIVGCHANSHCPYDKACIEGRCQNPCQGRTACGIGAACRAINHKTECTCPSNHTGDPKVRCTPFRPYQCEKESDCNSGFVCENNLCISVVQECSLDTACAPGKICEDNKCVVGCRRDSDCTFDKACINSQCLDPCSVPNVCSRNTNCRPVVHRPLCTCKPGFTGQPYVSCQQVPVSRVQCDIDKDCDSGKICEDHQCIVGCRKDSNCPTNKACINTKCENPCDFPDACGLHATCVPSSHKPVCTCQVGYTGDANVICHLAPIDLCASDRECSVGNICEEGNCIDACRTDGSCPYDKSCIKNRCQDPCSFYSACGTQAFCHAANHKAVCSCLPSFIGDPKVSCTKGETDISFCELDTDCVFGSICIDESCVEGCRNDDHCSPDMACIGQHCENPCSPPNSCGINAQCGTDFHRPVCTCKPGFVGDPNEKCTFVDTNNCTTDTDCPIQHICEDSRCGIGCRSYENCALEEACLNGICQNPCSVFGACGRNAICQPINHRPECFCPPNFHGNPNIICNGGYVDCNQDQDCELGKICDNKQCISGCRDDNNCPYNKVCSSGQCLNPCLLPNICGQNAECQPINHEVACSCPKNMIGSPVIKCSPIIDSYCHNDTQCPIGNICDNGKCIVGCRSDIHCAFEESCFNNHCQNPCTIFGACGENAVCNPFNHDRICSCPSQFTGNPKIQCVRIPAVVRCSKDTDCLASQICDGSRCTDGCYSDNNCPQNQACIRGNCANPCGQSGVCGKKALCLPFEHIPYCQCPSGFTGDPKVLCNEVVAGDQCKEDENCAIGSVCVQSQCVVGCRTNNNCPFNEACINTICQNPCLVGGVCGVNTLCQALNHEAVCSCLPGYTGSPSSECSVAQPVCEMDSDCGIGYVCVHQNCKDINECLQGHGPCATGAVCTNLPGNYKCSCLSDLTGDPYSDGCHPVVTKCHRDTDCKSNEACNRETEACYDLCSESDICGKRAKCKAINHQVECHCGIGLTGNPNLECSEIQTCVRHEECLGNLHCMGKRCNCPRPFKQEGFFCVLSSRNCSTTNPCPENQECIYTGVQNSLCVCPRGFVMMPNGICRDLNECDQVPFPCGQGAQCFNSEGSYICKCPWGTVGEPNFGGCKTLEGDCLVDDDCPSNQACDVTISKCHDPCLVESVCGLNAHCEVNNHSPYCLCPPGYTGNPNSNCHRIHGCQTTEHCPGNLICLPNKLCGCTGELSRIFDFCILTDRNCTTTSPCLDNQECVYTETSTGFCICPRGFSLHSDGSCLDINECVEQPQRPCSIGEYCRNTLGGYECRCPDGFRGDPYDGQCLRLNDGSGCQFDSDCLHSEVCDTSSNTCYNPCGQDQMCGQNAICKIENHKPVCYCPPEYSGNPLTFCFKVIQCGVDYNCPGNQVCLDTKTCGCPSQFQRRGDYCLLTRRNCTTSNPCLSNEECVYVGSHRGFCVCPRGFKIMPNGSCQDINECERSVSVCGKNGICTNLPGSYHCTCPVDTIGDPYLRGCTNIIKKCKVNDDCASDKECDRNSGECITPCYICGPRSTCTVTRHEAICVCPSNLIGDAYDKNYGCFNDVFGRTPAPTSDMSVMCLADGIQVSVHLDGFNGVLYVKGHSENPQCRRFVTNSDWQAVDFKVLFNTCGLIHVDGEASFILVIQKHPKLVTYRARAYHVKCVYNTGEKTISLGFNVSMITTSGTIANTGPPPSCKMAIVQANGKEITSAEVGDDLLLRVDVQPDYIYGGFARSCVAKTTDDNEEIEYQVTDDNGCATDPTVFGNWIIDPDTKLLEARFSAFKFPTSNNIRFQCNIRVCFGSCPPVNCNGVSTYESRHKRQALNEKFILGENFQEGTLREEIQVQSNAILTLDPKSEKVFESLDEPTISKIQNVCIPRLGFIISLVVTGLVALVAVAISISCWLMAYRKTSKPPNGPLPHPLDFPNPLHTSSEPIVAEPTPDYFPTPCHGF